MRYLFGRQGEPWCNAFDSPLGEMGEDCQLTLSDQKAIRKAIAGEGRLWCLPSDVTEVIYGYRQVNIYGQDQGGE